MDLASRDQGQVARRLISGPSVLPQSQARKFLIGVFMTSMTACLLFSGIVPPYA